MSAMGGWLRAGRRIEYAAAVYTAACYLVFGFAIANRAPIGVRWMAWLLGATFVLPFGLVFLLLGRWARRRANQSTVPVPIATKALTLKSRLMLYVALAAITVPSARVQERAIRAPLGELCCPGRFDRHR